MTANTEFPKYDILYIDPPWRYRWSRSRSRSIEAHYPTMTLEELKDLRVEQWMGKDCVVFLWVTPPKVFDAVAVVQAWDARMRENGDKGLEYKTNFDWDKLIIGPGYYGRNQHEHLWIITRGKPQVPKPQARQSSVMKEKRGRKHSKKPIAAYERIERMYPNKSKLELFAREPREGWDSLGYEVNNTDLRTDVS